MRVLPVSELNGPFLCPTLLTKQDCLESNQHLCLARQCPHRCVPVTGPALPSADVEESDCGPAFVSATVGWNM
ncbi:hypothetical protein DU083_05515 [Salmonella enterica subsp. enterica serovar Javiana]|nr:hypothetical protein [Salmonella enterica subsp. enterica serovar Javiana]